MGCIDLVWRETSRCLVEACDDSNQRRARNLPKPKRTATDIQAIQADGT